MGSITQTEIIDFIEHNIHLFHERRIDNLLSLKFNTILCRKNPYLFKAKNQVTACDLVKAILDAHLSSQEEGIFGGFLEQLSIYICEKVYNGKKSAAEGIDLELSKNNIVYIVTIKSGPNWGNSGQINEMKEKFNKAKRILGTNTRGISVVAVNGCCYGRDDKPDKGEYLKLCGQRFWEFISGDEELYLQIIEPLGYKAKEKNEQFLTEYPKVVNKFTLEFINEYCDPNGAIYWEKIVKQNSGKRK